MQDENVRIEPYRVLFPLGIISIFIGLLFWLLFQHRGISFYPRQAHANILFFAGLWSFVAGFMMTAVPKMTGTRQMDMAEFFVTVILIFLQISFSIRNQTHIAVGVFALQLFVLLVFLLRRFLKSRQIPFGGFYFLPFAFLQAALGVFIFYFRGSINYEILYALSGEAFLLNLIVGLGSRLIPVISRSPNAVMPNIASPKNNLLLTFFLALTLNAGIILEVIFKSQFGSLLKLAIVLVVSFAYFKLHTKPTRFSVAAYGLKTGIVLLNLSLIMTLVNGPNVAASHLLYIGVFLLITLMVSTRVMLAHGQQDVNYETKSPRLFLVLFLILLSAIFRYLAAININGLYMKVAIYFCMLALAIWGYKFVKILFKSK